VRGVFLALFSVLAQVGAEGPDEQPVLTDPRGALSRLPDDRDPLHAAETALLARDPRRTLAVLDGAALDSHELERRRQRLQLDAYVQLLDLPRARALLEALSQDPGWQQHVKSTEFSLERARLRDRVSGFGLLLYAMTMAILVLSGSRELLRVRREAAVALGSVVVAAVIVRSGPPVLAEAVLLASIAVVFLIHAAASAIRRHAPGPRQRVFLLATLVLGAFGAALAVFARVDLSYPGG
jgi:hypothetical protein